MCYTESEDEEREEEERKNWGLYTKDVHKVNTLRRKFKGEGINHG